MSYIGVNNYGCNKIQRILQNICTIPRIRNKININKVYKTLDNKYHVKANILNKKILYNNRIIELRSKRNFSSYPNHQILEMPSLSPTMETGVISSWEKKEGEKFEAGDSIANIETDKAVVSFDATETGYIAKILANVDGKQLSIGTPIAVIVYKETDVTAFSDFKISSESPESSESSENTEKPQNLEKPQSSENTSSTVKPLPTTEESSSSSTNKIQQPGDVGTIDQAVGLESGNNILKASPLARWEATKNGIDISELIGTGPNRRIQKKDVVQKLADNTTNSKSQQKQNISPTSDVEGTDYKDTPPSTMRRVIAKRLTESKQTIPHYYITMDICMDKQNNVRNVQNKKLSQQPNKDTSIPKLSVNDFLIKATACALIKVPEVNCSWRDNVIRKFSYADISVAVSTPTGQITPIIANANEKGQLHISNEVKQLAKRARDGKLAPNEYQGGTFSISNLGMYGVNNFTAIVNPPQSGIIAIGASTEKVILNPEYNKDPTKPQFITTSVMTVTASFDHRIVDGALGAQWISAFREFCENPETLLL